MIPVDQFEFTRAGQCIEGSGQREAGHDGQNAENVERLVALLHRKHDERLTLTAAGAVTAALFWRLVRRAYSITPLSRRLWLNLAHNNTCEKEG